MRGSRIRLGNNRVLQNTILGPGCSGTSRVFTSTGGCSPGAEHLATAQEALGAISRLETQSPEPPSCLHLRGRQQGPEMLTATWIRQSLSCGVRDRAVRVGCQGNPLFAFPQSSSTKLQLRGLLLEVQCLALGLAVLPFLVSCSRSALGLAVLPFLVYMGVFIILFCSPCSFLFYKLF